jgi:two-component system, chemotaxis family, protein-glutamate methylesterase/glutaminase
MSRVLVVDDDSGMRAALEARFIRRGWRVDTAASAREAMEKFRRGMHPLIVTDIRMPGEDGFFVMREAQAMTAHTAVILLTAYANIPEAVTAMKNGACDYVPKQMSSTSLEITHIRMDLISKIRAASQSPGARSRHPLGRKPPLSVKSPTQAFRVAPAIVAIATSTGGPKALEQILPCFPADFSLPILIVQHMPAGFTTTFARRLHSLCKLDVREAVHGEVVRPAVAYICPAGLHMRVQYTGSQVQILLSTDPMDAIHIPSADILMESVANVYRNRALGVIMTGMGSDGAEGIKHIYRAGGLTLGQDENTCTVYSMPRACAERGVLTQIVPLLEIPAEILHATRQRKPA